MAGTPQTLILTGVSGAGKTTVGRALAERTGSVLLDADDFHPESNRQKMASGTPLTDEDREAWIDALTRELARRAERDERVVLACSALRAEHRERLAAAADDVVVVHLDVSERELERRLRERADHFMPADLLASQLQDLDPPDPRSVVVVNGDVPVADVVDQVLDRAAR